MKKYYITIQEYVGGKKKLGDSRSRLVDYPTAKKIMDIILKYPKRKKRRLSL